MSRYRNKLSFPKPTKKSKGGYRLNKNGVPLDRNDAPVMHTQKYHYTGNLHVGHYRPTIHNISDI